MSKRAKIKNSAPETQQPRRAKAPRYHDDLKGHENILNILGKGGDGVDELRPDSAPTFDKWPLRSTMAFVIVFNVFAWAGIIASVAVIV